MQVQESNRYPGHNRVVIGEAEANTVKIREVVAFARGNGACGPYTKGVEDVALFFNPGDEIVIVAQPGGGPDDLYDASQLMETPEFPWANRRDLEITVDQMEG